MSVAASPGGSYCAYQRAWTASSGLCLHRDHPWTSSTGARTGRRPRPNPTRSWAGPSTWCGPAGPTWDGSMWQNAAAEQWISFETFVAERGPNVRSLTVGSHTRNAARSVEPGPLAGAMPCALQNREALHRDKTRRRAGPCDRHPLRRCRWSPPDWDGKPKVLVQPLCSFLRLYPLIDVLTSRLNVGRRAAASRLSHRGAAGVQRAAGTVAWPSLATICSTSSERNQLGLDAAVCASQRSIEFSLDHGGSGSNLLRKGEHVPP